MISLEKHLLLAEMEVTMYKYFVTLLTQIFLVSNTFLSKKVFEKKVLKKLFPMVEKYFRKQKISKRKFEEYLSRTLLYSIALCSALVCSFRLLCSPISSHCLKKSFESLKEYFRKVLIGCKNTFE